VGVNFNTGQVSVQSTATLIVAQNTGRKAVVITNLGTVAIYISYGSNTAAGPNVTTALGQILPGVVGASLSIPSTSAIWGISSGAAQSVSFLDA
jgi:hypothetical protein